MRPATQPIPTSGQAHWSKDPALFIGILASGDDAPHRFLAELVLRRHAEVPLQCYSCEKTWRVGCCRRWPVVGAGVGWPPRRQFRTAHHRPRRWASAPGYAAGNGPLPRHRCHYQPGDGTFARYGGGESRRRTRRWLVTAPTSPGTSCPGSGPTESPSSNPSTSRTSTARCAPPASRREPSTTYTEPCGRH
jgi:hypothetical protein